MIRVWPITVMFVALSSFGIRQISLPPIYYSTIHGATICTNPGMAAYKKYYDLLDTLIARTAAPPVAPASLLPECKEMVSCISADMTGREFTDPGGVICSKHYFRVALANLSDHQQTVTVTLKSDSKFSTAKNSAINVNIPDSPGNTLVINNGISQKVNLAAFGLSGDSHTLYFGFSCDGTNCQIGTNCPFGIFTTTVCLTQTSEVLFAIHVEEDHGAIQGTVNYSAHRHYGQAEKYSESMTYLINGGRPF